MAGAAAALLLPRFARAGQASGVHFSVAEFDRVRILRIADELKTAEPLTITAQTAPHATAKQRFYCDATVVPSTGDVIGYTTHADLLAAMSARVAAWTAAWRLTGQISYFEQAHAQVRAWCVDAATRMAPTLENESADAKDDADLRVNPLRFTLSLAEFARAASFLCATPAMPPEDAAAVRAWAAELLRWFTESERGGVARESTRADSIFWTMQASELARFARNDAVWRECGHRFRDKLLRQLHLNGYFPYALSERKPYAESMLLLECMGSACESLSTPFDNAWNYALPDGRGMRAAVAWAVPNLQSRGKWPYPADVRHFSEQPLRENALLFSGRAWNRHDYVDLWKTMTPDTSDAELKREHPITQPALWAVRPPA